MVEERLKGSAPSADACAAAARLAAEGTTVLPGAQDKRAMLRGTVLEALERAVAAEAG